MTTDQKTEFENENDRDLPPDIVHDDPAYQDNLEDSRAPLLSHLVELRTRLIKSMIAVVAGFVICFIFSQPLYDVLTVPYIEAVQDRQGGETAVFNYKPLELFFARVKLALVAGVMLAFPVIAREIYGFIAPGLYKNEKKAVFPFLVAIPFLFAAGIALVYFLIMPFVIQFALSMEQPAVEGRAVAYSLFLFVGDYLNLIMTLMLAFGFAFQLPVILTLLAIAGLIDAEFLSRNRRFAIVGIFLVAAFLTPPDPVSQLALGGTIWGLYEISILAVRLVAKRRDEQDPANEANSLGLGE